jgi:hypothetical protein
VLETSKAFPSQIEFCCDAQWRIQKRGPSKLPIEPR